MALTRATGIRTGAPITDPSAVWAPPTVGPSDHSHCWMADTLRGTDTSGGVTRLPDMSGGRDLTTGAPTTNTFRDGDPSAAVSVPAGSGALSASGGTVRDQTVLIVAQLVGSKSSQIRVPGWVVGGGAANSLMVNSANTGLPVPSAMALYVLTLTTGGTCTARVNGSEPVAVTSTPGTGTSWAIGTNVYSSAVDERYSHVRTWDRILTADEIAAAASAAKRLHGI